MIPGTFATLMALIFTFCLLAILGNAAWKRGHRCGRHEAVSRLRARRLAKARRKKAAADVLTDAQFRKGIQVLARDERFRASMRRAQLTVIQGAKV